ncbi:MAG: glycosyltransferase family 2 protein [Reyranella sp.]|uniref:glycosyltransferase family 2 protein n=1 Tax=Reyranella sp. TaxID=1929291 RepID=UPI001208E24E|nr:glycosyltransferase family 2 protein [Reyranella sp.]TAJ90172.1 MAG: glycosyltransferase family 2 protein [Reyranella sp.]TBR26765.1 MAG: glycosyltransferase family 2 protein [Reyranella sp.]
MDRDTVTPLLITFNEIQNIERTLAKLDWAKCIVAIDSGSTDGTLDMLAKDPRIEVIPRPFDSFAEQCNFGLTHIRTDWVLSLDADYELSDALVSELTGLRPAVEDRGYRAAFVYRIYGRPLRGTLYPPRTVLYRVAGARYENEGHGHRIRLQGRISDLKGVIYHDDRKPLSRWLGSQLKYAAREAAHLLEMPRERLGRVDRIRLMGWPAPILVLGYVLFAKGAILDGRAGWFYAFQRLLAEVLLALELLDRRLSSGTK